MELLQWWNLIFLLPAVTALLLLVLLAFGAIPVAADLGDIDLDPTPDIETDAHDPSDGQHDTGASRGPLSILGVGRIPLSLVLMSFAFLWGLFGLAAIQLFSRVLPSPALFIWPSLAVALVGAGLVTHVLAVRLGRFLPQTESYGASSSELVGQIADVRYSLTETSGTVQLYDRYGALFEVPARVMPGEPPIPSGEQVVLWRFDPAGGAYFAVQDDVISRVEPGRSQSANLPIR